MNELSPQQKRKVDQITEALEKSGSAVYDHFISLDTFERSVRRSTTGRISGEWIKTFTKLRKELLRARDRLDELETGLLAQRQLRKALTQSAAAVEAWQDAMDSDDVKAITAARKRMSHHFDLAAELGTKAAANLEKGR